MAEDRAELAGAWGARGMSLRLLRALGPDADALDRRLGRRSLPRAAGQQRRRPPSLEHSLLFDG